MVKSKSRERQIEGQSEELEAWMVSGIKGREGKNQDLDPNIPVHSQTKPCTIDVLPLYLFLFRSMQKQQQQENGSFIINRKCMQHHFR